MGESFTKLESSILESTIWGENDQTRIVWVTMMAMADANGCVRASVPGLARRANLHGVSRKEAIKIVEQALAKFQEPDLYSRSEEHDGRRIEIIDRGWRLLNYRRIRDARDLEARREYERERKREQRQRKRDAPDSPGQSRTVPQDDSAPAQVEESQPEKKPPRKAKKTEPENVATVLDAIDEERRQSGVPNAKRKIPAPAAAIKAVKARLAEVGLERVMRVVRRKGVDCRQRPVAVINGSETRTVRFLTAVSIMRPDNFARMDEADELDEASAADSDHALEFRTESDGVLMARTRFGWREATKTEREQHAVAT